MRLHSLVGRPELNGKRGEVAVAFAEWGRVGVKIEGEGGALFGIKPKSCDDEGAVLARACGPAGCGDRRELIQRDGQIL